MPPWCYHDATMMYNYVFKMDTQHILENINMYHCVYIMVASCWHPVHLIHKQSWHNNVSLYHSVYIAVASWWHRVQIINTQTKWNIFNTMLSRCYSTHCHCHHHQTNIVLLQHYVFLSYACSSHLVCTIWPPHISGIYMVFCHHSFHTFCGGLFCIFSV